MIASGSMPSSAARRAEEQRQLREAQRLAEEAEESFLADLRAWERSPDGIEYEKALAAWIAADCEGDAPSEPASKPRRRQSA
jgi:hypothetical protein